ncbi:MAG: HEAT repeat domain-containing protein [Candidatus Coatesbacteria bacterium]|nr:HEAT repeat domain-containing protein [Candidatus Coatesbacteria bacterium]
MFKRWAFVIGIGLAASLLVAFASYVFQLDTAPQLSTGPALTPAPVVTEPGRTSPKPTLRAPHELARPVDGPPSTSASSPNLDSLDTEGLIDLLGTGDNQATKLAARKLESLGSEAAPALIKRLESTFDVGGKSSKLRWWCVNTLGNIRDGRATPVLVECAAHDADPHTRWRSIWALNVIRDDRRIDLLREKLKSTDQLVRFNAATALSTMDVDDGIKVIEEAINSEDDWLRWQAVSALGRVKSPETVRLLIGCLKDSKTSIRQEAAMSLGRLDDIEAAPALIEALSDPEGGVRWRAARSLGQLGAKKAIPRLKELLVDPDGSTRSQVAVALGELGCKDRDAAQKVIGMLSDPDKDVRSKAAIAIGRVGSSEDIGALENALAKEEEQYIRRKLQRSLKALRSTGESSSAAPVPDSELTEAG